MDNFELILKNACNILAEGMEQRNENRELAKLNYGKLLDAHMLVVGVIGSEVISKSLVQGESNASISGRLSLLASFIQGIDLCETSITEGLYVQASTLLKQEMETVAAMQEYVDDNRKNQKTPNVGKLKWGLNTLYGEINKLAHVADESTVNPLFKIRPIGDAKPVSIKPIYNKTISRRLYGLHVALLIQLAIAMEELHKDMYNEGFSEKKYEALNIAIQNLYDEGWLVEDEEFVDDPDWPQPRYDN